MKNKIKPIKAWAIIDKTNAFKIPIFNVGNHKIVNDVKSWAIFGSQLDAKKMIRESRNKREPEVKYAKIIPVLITPLSITSKAK